MKKIFITTLLLVFTLHLFSQVDSYSESRSSITVGLLQGGGSLVGADFETLLTNKFGIQIGAGLLGYGAGLNYHFRPSIRSSFLSLQYWHQGVGSSYAQSMIGPTYVFRGRRWFTAQIGLGFALGQGPAFPSGREQIPVMLLYSIGAYFPI